MFISNFIYYNYVMLKVHVEIYFTCLITYLHIYNLCNLLLVLLFNLMIIINYIMSLMSNGNFKNII